MPGSELVHILFNNGIDYVYHNDWLSILVRNKINRLLSILLTMRWVSSGSGFNYILCCVRTRVGTVAHISGMREIERKREKKKIKKKESGMHTHTHTHTQTNTYSTANK